MYPQLLVVSICTAIGSVIFPQVALAATSLQVSTVNNQTEFINLLPGLSKSQTLIIKNTSDTGSALTLSGQLNNSFTENPAGSYDALKDAIQIRLSAVSGDGSPWTSLATWVKSAQSFPGDPAKPGDEVKYNLEVMVRGDANPSVANQSLSQLTLTIYGQPATTSAANASHTNDATLNLGVLGTATNQLVVKPGSLKLTAEAPPTKPTPAVLGAATLDQTPGSLSPSLVFLILGLGIGLLLIVNGLRMCLHRQT